jgi:hypothetical protein
LSPSRLNASHLLPLFEPAASLLLEGRTTYEYLRAPGQTSPYHDARCFGIFNCLSKSLALFLYLGQENEAAALVCGDGASLIFPPFLIPAGIWCGPRPPSLLGLQHKATDYDIEVRRHRLMGPPFLFANLDFSHATHPPFLHLKVYREQLTVSDGFPVSKGRRVSQG